MSLSLPYCPPAVLSFNASFQPFTPLKGSTCGVEVNVVYIGVHIYSRIAGSTEEVFTF